MEILTLRVKRWNIVSLTYIRLLRSLPMRFGVKFDAIEEAKVDAIVILDDLLGSL